MKKLVFVSNYVAHYQLTLSKEFVKIYGDDYTFIATTPFNKMRLSTGGIDFNQMPFVHRAYESLEAAEKAKKLIDEAECLIVGGVPVSVISSRLNLKKFTFMYSERFFKGPFFKDIVRYFKYLLYSGGRSEARRETSNFYLLSTSAFATWDYNICGLFRNKAYRWAYFPETKRCDDIDTLISQKEPAKILWVGRFLNWKHPELAVRLAKNLKSKNINFTLKIIGAGEMQDKLAKMADDMNLNDCVKITMGGGGIIRTGSQRNGNFADFPVHLGQRRRLGSCTE